MAGKPKKKKAKPAKPVKTAKSQTKAAIRSRKRRAQAKREARLAEERRLRKNAQARARYAVKRGIEQQKKYEAEAKRKKTAERKKRRGGPPDERARMASWLESIRNRLAQHFRVSLSLTEPEVGAKTPWTIVGRFDPQEDVDYLTFGHGLDAVERDDMLAARIHPQRTSQIRVVYKDPRSKRDEGSRIVSKFGPWEFVISDLRAEVIGSGDDDPDALATRYDETLIEVFYVYFSVGTSSHRDVTPWRPKR